MALSKNRSRRENVMRTADTVVEEKSIAAIATMKALVYHGPGRKAWEEKPTPRIQHAADAIVRITTPTICGTDLHILKGDVPGAGPIGLAALLTAQFYSPAEIMMIDLDDNRLEVARSLGATKLINSSDGKAVQRVMDLTGGAGVDVAIEAVGVPTTFDVCQAIVTAGGHVANIGVHGKPVELRLERLWSHNVTITTRLVDTAATPMLLKVV